MDFDSLSSREAQLYIEGYAQGMKSFSDVVDVMEPVFGDRIPCSELRQVADYLFKGHMTKTMAHIMAMYDEKERML